MMTIDEMLSKVADNAGVAQPKMTAQNEVKTVKIAPLKKESNTESIKIPVINVSESLKSEKPCLTKKITLNLKLAKEIAYCVEKAAEAIGVNVVTAVSDCSGRLICLEAMDNSFIASIQAAQDKAFTAVALKMPTHEALKQSRGGDLDGYTNGNGILMLAGGTPITYNGEIIGAVGVSGGTKDQDMLLSNIGKAYFARRTETL